MDGSLRAAHEQPRFRRSKMTNRKTLNAKVADAEKASHHGNGVEPMKIISKRAFQFVD